MSLFCIFESTQKNTYIMLNCTSCPFQSEDNSSFYCLSKFTSVEHKPFNKGQVIFNENERLGGLYCIQKGTCKVSKMGSNGREQIIELLTEKTLLGIRSVLNEEITNLKATAITPMQVCFVPKNVFLETLKKNDDFTVFLCQLLANYIKNTDDKILDMGQKSVGQRVAKLLLSMENYFESDESGFVKVKIRREDMANMIGVATESLIRTLSNFQKQQWIETKGKNLRIVNRNKLMSIDSGLA